MAQADLKEYFFYIDGLNREASAIAHSEKEAFDKVWGWLTDFEKDVVACLDCIDIREVAQPAEAVVSRFREIAEHMPGPLKCDNGLLWHPTEIFGLLALLEQGK